jgi:putative ABC transport system permease protein
MIGHLLKMVWNRKRANALVIVEIFFSFVVLFSVSTIAVYHYGNFRKPLGYSMDGVWDIEVSTFGHDEDNGKETLAGLQRITVALRDLPEIARIGGMASPPYARGYSIFSCVANGDTESSYANAATDGAGEALGIDVVEGRWFGKEDDGAQYPPAVINEHLAHEFFGTADPIGKEITNFHERVVGVIRDFRMEGDFAKPDDHIFSRIGPTDTSSRFGGSYDLLIKLKPGTTAAFEEPLTRTLEGVKRDWAFRVYQLEEEREADIRSHLFPLIVEGSIGGFMVLMVALGLVGALWQNVTQRTKELGLRRAVGAERKRIIRQILGEQVVVTSIGVAAGSILVWQAPLLNLIPDVDVAVYLLAFFLSLISIYAITFLCGLFPSRVAAEIQPVEALHYD